MTDKKNTDRQSDLTETVATAVSRARETYWDAVGAEAVARVGRGPQLKGVIHEIAVRNERNLSIEALTTGLHTELVRSMTAHTVDLVTKDALGKVVERLQLKDVTSRAGLRDLEARVRSGQYRSARLVGTEETTAGYAELGLEKPMASSGVSSATTTRAADNAGANVRNADLLATNVKDLAGFAGIVIGGILGGLGGAFGGRGLGELFWG